MNVYYIWQTGESWHHCETCANLGGTVGTIDEFAVRPGFHEGCHCRLRAFRIADEPGSVVDGEAGADLGVALGNVSGDAAAAVGMAYYDMIRVQQIVAEYESQGLSMADILNGGDGSAGGSPGDGGGGGSSDFGGSGGGSAGQGGGGGSSGFGGGDTGSAGGSAGAGNDSLGTGGIGGGSVGAGNDSLDSGGLGTAGGSVGASDEWNDGSNDIDLTNNGHGMTEW